jgi:hypothetical protein
VEGFKTIAEHAMRARRMNRVHKPAMIRSRACRLGARGRASSGIIREQVVTSTPSQMMSSLDTSRTGYDFDRVDLGRAGDAG